MLLRLVLGCGGSNKTFGPAIFVILQKFGRFNLSILGKN